MPPLPPNTLRRFFAAPARFKNDQVTLDPEESHHLAQVLRLKPGAQVVVVDGQGRQVQAQVARLAPDGVVLTLEREIGEAAESPVHLTLALALAKTEALDLVIRQATELGVKAIAPFTSTYSEKLPQERAAKRLERWRKLTREALKSCQRAWLPTIQPIQDFSQVLSGPEAMKLFCWENQRGGGLAALLTGPPPQGLRVVIGPEGGFTPPEAAQARDAGYQLISLGPRRLKVETAALTVLALIQGNWGDLA